MAAVNFTDIPVVVTETGEEDGATGEGDVAEEVAEMVDSGLGCSLVWRLQRKTSLSRIGTPMVSAANIVVQLSKLSGFKRYKLMQRLSPLHSIVGVRMLAGTIPSTRRLSFRRNWKP